MDHAVSCCDLMTPANLFASVAGTETEKIETTLPYHGFGMYLCMGLLLPLISIHFDAVIYLADPCSLW